MTKQEKIQEEWIKLLTKETYDKVKYFIDESGFLYFKITGHGLNNGLCFRYFNVDINFIHTKRAEQPGNYYWRPKSLQGIENNNGWIKIESEADLPKEEIDCHFIKDNLMYQGLWDNLLKGFYNGLQKINATHYQPITKPNPPIY